MTTLIISNSRTEEMVGDLLALTPTQRQAGGWGAQRMLWFARDGDVVVLPWAPEDAYLDYLTALTGTRSASLTLVVPPPGFLGADLLTPDRLADEGFRDELRNVLADRSVDSILAAYKDFSIVELAESLGIERAVPGYRFSAQGGDALVNSKATFRAVAAGAGIPIAPGIVARQQQQAEATITALLTQGYTVMVKQEFAGGGFGNEILSPADGVRPAGAQKVVVLPDRPAIMRYVAERWAWLTGGRDHRLVIERYFPDSITVYAEFLVTDNDSQLLGVGEILMEPVAVGEIVPPPSLTPDARAWLVDAGRRLCEQFRMMGYRGNISADAILTTEGEIVFTETNGRITGSTHLHTVVGGRIVDEEHRGKRVFLEHDGWAVPSFSAAVEQLTAAGLTYDPDTQTGVVLTANYVPVNGTVMYCVVAEDLESARVNERRLTSLSIRVPA
jgi:hypothetical protein